MAAGTADLDWVFRGQPRKRSGRDAWTPQLCDACNGTGAGSRLNVWQRMGIGFPLFRCWGHGPGLTGASCDGPQVSA